MESATTPLPLRAPPILRFTAADSERANREWKATCGPHALAAACGVTLDEVRKALYDYRGWMNPTRMGEALLSLGVSPTLRRIWMKTHEPCNGISRVQFEGEWLDPGVPPAVAYHHTHWVAHFDGWVLCTACRAAEWITLADWKHHLLEVEPVSPFFITHHFEMPAPAILGT